MKIMNNLHKDARQLLPNMPEEIFNLWFDEQIKNKGWPPEKNYLWKGLLRYKSLDYWTKLQWKNP